MGGGSGGGAPTTSTQYTSNLPEYARPYFERMMGRAEAESNQPYVGYQAPRIAGFGADQRTGFDITREAAARGTPEVEAGAGLAGAAGMRGLAASGYQAAPIRQEAFGTQQAQQYMSPYMSEVLARQKEAAVRDYDEGRPTREAQAIRSGAFGGYRSAIQEGVAQRGLQNRMADIEATGRQKAFESAQAQFERDRVASMTAQYQTEAQRLAGEQYGLAGAGLGLQSGAALGQLGAARQGLTLAQAEALQKQGALQQGQEQKSLDIAYQDFLNQRDFEKQQINYLSQILRGVPVQPQQVVNQYQTTNPYAQFAGLGIAGLGLARS